MNTFNSLKGLPVVCIVTLVGITYLCAPTPPTTHHIPAPVMPLEYAPALPATQAEHVHKTDKSVSQSTRLPPTVVLWSWWRSGSSFSAQLLVNGHSDKFYSPEPLHQYGDKIFNETDSNIKKLVDLMRDILHCQFSNHLDYIDYWKGKQAWNFMGRQRNVTRVTSLCHSAGLHVVKLLRLPLRFAHNFLSDPSLNIQVIYLVRDPRATMSSRQLHWWCRHPTCKDPVTVCSLIKNDLEEAVKLQSLYPKRFKTVVYDKFCLEPIANLQDVMNFLNLPVREEQLKMLRWQGTLYHAGTFKKNSTLQAQLWRTMANFQAVVAPVQQHCRDSLDHLGLRVFTTEEIFRNINISSFV